MLLACAGKVALESVHHAAQRTTGAGARDEHDRVHHLLHGVDDVRGAGCAYQGAARPQRNPIRPAGRHPGAQRFAGTPAAGHAR
ncbi:hypothetical protein D3C80_1620740 [compost metagenome]